MDDEAFHQEPISLGKKQTSNGMVCLRKYWLGV
jgi:hypothetical protein